MLRCPWGFFIVTHFVSIIFSIWEHSWTFMDLMGLRTWKPRSTFGRQRKTADYERFCSSNAPTHVGLLYGCTCGLTSSHPQKHPRVQCEGDLLEQWCSRFAVFIFRCWPTVSKLSPIRIARSCLRIIICHVHVVVGRAYAIFFIYFCDYLEPLLRMFLVFFSWYKADQLWCTLADVYEIQIWFRRQSSSSCSLV